MGEIQTINETDFVWFDGELKGITQAILYDAVGTDHIPAVVGASMVKDNEPIGYMTSKHIHSSPHTFLEVGFTGWAIYRNDNCLIVEVLTPAHISKDIGQQKNAWLFNYPPARDVAKMLVNLGVKDFFVLTSDTFDRMMEEEIDSCVIVKGEDIGGKEAYNSLQPLWGWLPAFMFSVESAGAKILIIPSHGARLESLTYDESHIREALDLLKKNGYNTVGAIKRSKGIYDKASSEANEAAKMANEVVARMKTKNKRDINANGMFG